MLETSVVLWHINQNLTAKINQTEQKTTSLQSHQKKRAPPALHVSHRNRPYCDLLLNLEINVYYCHYSHMIIFTSFLKLGNIALA